jgi:hypothetical protein
MTAKQVHQQMWQNNDQRSQRKLTEMAADWHPSDGFEPLAMRLFVGASYASTAHS